MFTSLREALFGLGGHTVQDLKARQDSIRQQKVELYNDADQASAARVAAIAKLTDEVAVIAYMQGNL